MYPRHRSRASRRSRWHRRPPGRAGGLPSSVSGLLDWPSFQSTLWTVAAFVALVALFHLVLPKPVPLGMMLYGVVIGCINALIAVGLILIHRANRIINFAQAEIGIFGGPLFEELDRQAHVAWLLSLVLGVAAGRTSQAHRKSPWSSLPRPAPNAGCAAFSHRCRAPRRGS